MCACARGQINQTNLPKNRDEYMKVKRHQATTHHFFTRAQGKDKPVDK